MRYGGAIAAVVVAVAARLALDPALGDLFPYTTLYLAVLVVAGYAGRGPALLATGLGAVAAARFLIPPRGAWLVQGFENRAGLALYLGVGVGVALLGGALRAARRRAEIEADEAVRQRDQLRITLASIGDAVLVTDAEGLVTSLNPVAEVLTGWTSAEAAGQPLPSVFRIVNEETRLEVDNPALRALREGVVVGLANHTILIARDGTERPIDDSAAPVRDGSGSVTGAVLVFRDVDERRRAERALAESEARKAAVLETALDAIITIDHQGKIVEFNPAAEATFGHARSVVMGREMCEFIVPPSLRDAHRKGMARYLATGEGPVLGKRIEIMSARADGTEFPVELAITRISAAGPPLFTAHVRDITERKRVEEALQSAHRELEARVAERTADLARANQFLRALLESIQEGIVGCDAEGVLTLFNRATQEFHGLPPEPLPADQWADHYDLYGADGTTPLSRQEIPLFRALRGERVQGVEMVIAPRNGSMRTLLASGQAFHDDQGRTLGAVVSMHDITARKEAEEALREAHDELDLRVAERTAELRRANEALREADLHKDELLASLRDGEVRFRTMAESIPQLAWMARPDGHIYWYNKRWHEYTGTTPEQMEGWGWQSVHDPEVLPSVLERWGASIASGEPFDMVFPLKGADGRFRPFLTRVAPVRGEDGRVAHWFGTNTDIADRQKIQDELRAAKEEAEAASQAKTQFLAVLSHELRTPLNPILLAASSMLEHPGEPEEIRPTLEMIRQNVNLQARLIDDLLDVMRIVRGKMPLHWGISDCHELIGHAIEVCRSEFQGTNLQLTTELGARHHFVNTDSARFQQVLWNLIKNAVKFTPRGGSITVRTRNQPATAELGGTIVIEVSDTGIGIEPEILPQIFDPFQQGETTITRRFGGLGLGLAICKGIIEAHGGTLEVESGGRDRGTTFRVVLKALDEQSAERNSDPNGGKPESRPGLPSPLRILVVEDEPATLRLMARLLRGLGHEVTAAATVTAAVEAVEAGEFDLIVSDIGLPDGTGLDLMRRVVAMRGPVPAIALTGYGMEEDIVRSRQAGFTSHMTKPIDFTKLEAMIRQVAE